MVNFYVVMIKNKKTTLDKVPAKWREQVKQKLIDEGIYEE